MRLSELGLWAAGSLCLISSPAGCGSKFSAGTTGGAAGLGAEGGVGTGGGATGGSAGESGGSGGSAGTGGSSGTGGAGAGGTPGTGGTDSDAGPADDASVLDAGTCPTLTALTFHNGGFESGALLPGWVGAPNPPYYAEVVAGAARSGSFGVEFNDTGAGVPGIQQLVAADPLLVGRQVTVDAWVRLVSFPSIRLLVWANNALGNHIGSAFADTSAVTEWQRLSTTITVPPATDHLMVMLISATGTADGVAHCDDVRLCLDDACSSC